MGASAAAAAIIAKEKHIVAAFRQARATSTETAVAPETIGVAQHFVFAKLKRRAILREAGPGRFYLDELAWEALGRFRRRLALGILLLIVAAMLSYALLRQ